MRAVRAEAMIVSPFLVSPLGVCPPFRSVSHAGGSLLRGAVDMGPCPRKANRAFKTAFMSVPSDGFSVAGFIGTEAQGRPLW